MSNKLQKMPDELLARYLDGLADENEKQLVKAYFMSNEKALEEAVEASRAMAFQKMAAERFSDMAYELMVRRLVRDGIIDGNAIRKRRWAYLSALFATLVLAFVICWMIFKPLDIKVNLVEDTEFSIPSLPFESGNVSYSINANEPVKVSVNRENMTVLIENISFKDKCKKLHLVFESIGYQTVDTVVKIRKSLELPLRRDNSLGLIFGNVIDELGNPVPNAKIIVQDIETQTDSVGNFRLDIPFAKQMESQRMQINKEGFEFWTGTYRPSNTYGWNVMLHRKQKQ